MKTFYKLLLLLMGFTFIACDDDNGNPNDNLTLDMEVESPYFQNDTIWLDESLPNETAVTFTWDKAARNFGPDFELDYIFRLDVVGNEFKTSTDPEIINEVQTKSFTTKEINDLLVDKWNVFGGDVVELEARIVAKVEGPKFYYPEIGTTKFKILGFSPPAEYLYLYGTATSAGTDLEKAIRMDLIANGKQYSWKGNLKQGDFKILNSRESLLPSLNKGKDNTTLVERTSESDPDTYFTIGADDPVGLYAIYIDKTEMRIDYQHVLYENLYLIGDGCEAEWELNSALAFNWNPATPNVLTLETYLKEGEIKILTERDWSSYTFRPLVADGSILSTDAQGYLGDPDLKWKITAEQAGEYIISMNPTIPTITFTKK